jgi:SAM-dependent methyltransferase
MPVHDVAARGFGDSAESYEKARPTYPSDAVEWLTANLRVGPGARVCDLAAGTGKLTRALAGTGAALIAVEPVAGMRSVLHRELPGVATLGAVAEALPFPSQTLDGVVVAQAFHWFDAALSLGELHRAIRPSGRLGLIWNAWDGSVPWIDQIHQVVADAGSTEQWQRGHWSREWVVQAIDGHGGFSTVERARFPHGQLLTIDGVVERVATTSHIASASAADRDRTLAAVREILDGDPRTRGREQLHFAYVVDAYWCERR